MTDMTASMTAETRANDGYDACDGFLHSLYRHLPTPCASRDSTKGGRCLYRGIFQQPVISVISVICAEFRCHGHVISVICAGKRQYPLAIPCNRATVRGVPCRGRLSTVWRRPGVARPAARAACLRGHVRCSLMTNWPGCVPPCRERDAFPDTGLPLKGQAPAQTVKAARQRRTVHSLPDAGACPTPGCPGRLKTTGKGASAVVFCRTCKYRGYVTTLPPASRADEFDEGVIV